MTVPTQADTGCKCSERLASRINPARGVSATWRRLAVADTRLLTIPDQLGVEYYVHVLESLSLTSPRPRLAVARSVES